MSPWPMAPLRDLADSFFDGDWIEKKDQAEGGIRLIQTGNVGQGVFKPNEDRARFISPETFDRLGCSEVFPGDLLISRLPEPIGRACVVPELDSKLITAVDCAVLRLGDRVLPEFFIHYSMTPRYLFEVRQQASGTTRQRISRANLGDINIPVPPISEQKRIIAELDEFNSQGHQLASRIDQQSQELRLLRQAVLSDRIPAALNSQEARSAGKPDRGEWPHKPIGELLTLEYGKALSKEKRDPEGAYPAYGANGVKTRTHDYLVQGDSVIVGRKGSAGSITRVSGGWWPLDVTYYVSLRSDQLDIDYLYLALGQMNLPSLARGVKPGINRNDVYQLQISVPSLEEQSRIVAEVKEFDSVLAKLDAQLSEQKIELEAFQSIALAEALEGGL